MAGKNIIELYNYVNIICSIDCTKCGRTETANDIDEYYFIEYLDEQGWRITVKNCYCPKCVKKYLKK